MKPKVLFVANIAKHIISFHLPYLKWFQEQGFETHVASNGSELIPYCDYYHCIPIQRSPFDFRNFVAYVKLKEIIDQHHFALIHCHTPMGGVVARLAALKSRKSGTTVLYTSHGFHFFKGAPIFNWIFYYPVEKVLSRYTDGIIAINKEDYDLLKVKKFQSSNKHLIRGIGVDAGRFKPISGHEKQILREKHGYSGGDFILIYVAEFIPRKNHLFIVRAAANLITKMPNIKIIFAGRGQLFDQINELVSACKLDTVISLVGFKTNIESFMSISDLGISSSKHEGLPVNLVEEMFIGLPILASDTRGNRELVIHQENGYLYQPDSEQEFAEHTLKLYNDSKMCYEFGKKSSELAQSFSLENVLDSMTKIYIGYLGEQYRLNQSSGST